MFPILLLAWANEVDMQCLLLPWKVLHVSALPNIRQIRRGTEL